MTQNSFKDYKIIRSNYEYDLEEKVKKYLKDGYVLVGGVSVSKHLNDEIYAQAIVKYS